MKLITTLILVLSVIFTNCRREKEKNNNGLGLLLLLAASNRGLTGSQSTAEVFANNSSVTSEDSAEASSGVSGSSSKAFTYSGTNLGGTLTISNEVYDCFLGGTITFNGSNTFIADGTDVYNRTTTLTNGTRTITYDNCVVSSSVTINSGTLTFTQLAPDSGTTSMKTEVISGTTSSGTLRRTLTNWKGTLKGSMTVTLTGRRGTGTGTIEHDHTIVLPSRVRTWTLINGRVFKPVLVSRSGTLTGTTTINGTKYTINKTLDVNLD
ncbi:MAG: hypothetical protein SFU98_05085 [Leptospiraceae bacterium]|nr:hypothetical protein [Leptospiraceae bacterium]